MASSLKTFYSLGNAISLVFIVIVLTSSTAYGGTLKGFKEAERYTVKIKSRIDYPFFEDTTRGRMGAGFLVDKERGWVVTNAHVTTRNPKSLVVSFKTKKRFDGELIYADAFLDLAVVKIPVDVIPEDTPEAVLDCAFKATIGHAVGAFGHPFSLSFTGTRGIVSGYNFDEGKRHIQTDAPINKGNSGGPLIDLQSGKVVGVNSSGYSKDLAEGIGFAIPAQRVCRILDLLKRNVDPSPPTILAEFATDPDEKTGLNVAVKYSSEWKLQVGDKLLRRDADRATKFETLGDFIDEMRSGNTSQGVVVLRNGKEHRVSLPLTRVPKILDRKGLSVSGATIAPLIERDSAIEPYGKHLMIHHVKRGSEARLFGLKFMDRIVSVDGHEFLETPNLSAYLKVRKSENKKVRFLVYRRKGSYRTASTYKLIEIMIENIKNIGLEK